MIALAAAIVSILSKEGMYWYTRHYARILNSPVFMADYISAQENVICIDSLHSRMFGNKTYVDLEIQVDGNLSLRDAHAIAEHIHDNVEEHFSDVKHITIHLNPAV